MEPKKRFPAFPTGFPVVFEKAFRARKHFVPARLEFYLALKRYRREILSLGFQIGLYAMPGSLLRYRRGIGTASASGSPGVESPLKGLALIDLQAPVPVVR